jgi:hypothetical protein
VDGDSPLGIYPFLVLGDFGYSGWAMLCVKDICPVAGMSCVDHEEYTLALLTAFEEDHHREKLASLSSFKWRRELKARLLVMEKARLTFLSVKCFMWALGGDLWVFSVVFMGFSLVGFCLVLGGFLVGGFARSS